MKHEPVRLLPAFKDYLWGGTRLKTDYFKKTDLNPVAESWELSAHKDGESIIASGADCGLSFGEYIRKNDVLGKNAAAFDFFPILIKFIDAKDNLSVQVHPDDEYAMKNNGEYGKTEMWYIMDCEEGAYLYFGFNRTVTKEELLKRISENTLLEVLNKVPVKAGDVFFIKSGTVHAIGKGIMICEIQQSSNTTYRVYDYNRRDKDGNTRPLHIDRAVEVADLTPPENVSFPDGVLAKCKYFTVEKHKVSDRYEMYVDESCFKSIIVLSGAGELKSEGSVLDFKKGDSLFLPADCGKVEILGECEIIVSYV